MAKNRVIVQPQRYGRYSSHVASDNFTDETIAPRHRKTQHTINIVNRAGEAIHLIIEPIFSCAKPLDHASTQILLGISPRPVHPIVGLIVAKRVNN